MASSGVRVRFWSLFSAPAGRIPGVTRHMPGPTSGRTAASSSGDSTSPVQAEVACLPGPAQDERRGALRVAGRREVVVVGRSQHRDAEQFQAARAEPHQCRRHRLRIGMHGEESGAEPGDLRRRPRHRVRDVVQLQVEEDALAVRDKPTGRSSPPT